MPFAIPLIALVLMIGYIFMSRRQDETWKQYRERIRERSRNRPDQPPDPSFQFEDKPSDQP